MSERFVRLYGPNGLSEDLSAPTTLLTVPTNKTYVVRDVNVVATPVTGQTTTPRSTVHLSVGQKDMASVTATTTTVPDAERFTGSLPIYAGETLKAYTETNIPAPSVVFHGSNVFASTPDYWGFQASGSNITEVPTLIYCVSGAYVAHITGDNVFLPDRQTNGHWPDDDGGHYINRFHVVGSKSVPQPASKYGIGIQVATVYLEQPFDGADTCYLGVASQPAALGAPYANNGLTGHTFTVDNVPLSPTGGFNTNVATNSVTSGTSMSVTQTPAAGVVQMVVAIVESSTLGAIALTGPANSTLLKTEVPTTGVRFSTWKMDVNTSNPTVTTDIAMCAGAIIAWDVLDTTTTAATTVSGIVIE